MIEADNPFASNKPIGYAGLLPGSDSFTEEVFQQTPFSSSESFALISIDFILCKVQNTNVTVLLIRKLKGRQNVPEKGAVSYDRDEFSTFSSHIDHQCGNFSHLIFCKRIQN
jgi:hypothetical protein